ncbi:alpha/beta fold hydrolase [Longitalea arenae]|uniref:alpha/beta fold hydrolase n=1 Tax=Longitalea arenae TaxID=2812558 RepID=UPI001968302A|nr:alpha/beta hydrolase [Longitalea arenae]
MPLLLLMFFLVDILSIAYPFIAYYLWREWDKFNDTVSDDYAERCLYGAIAVALFILLGRFIVKLLISKRRSGEEEPRLFHSSKRDTIKRPDGSRINVEYFGKEDGPPIIFVHGWNANTNNWYYQRKFFESGYRLIMMDLPGLGKSTRPGNRDFSLEKMAADLEAVIEHTNARNAVLWGHSMGGMTILSLFANHRYSNRIAIKALILEHTTYTNPVRTMMFSKLMTAIEKPVLRPLCWLIIALSPLVWISRWMSYMNGHSHIVTRLLTFAGTQTQKQLDFSTLLSTMAPPAVMARGVLAMFKYDVTSQLPQITIPALVIAANKDRLTKPIASEFMYTHMPSAKLTTVSPGNHQSLLERHKEVNEAAKNFIETLS